MSRPFWTARFLTTRAALPSKLERGRAYFIADEQIIIVDYGNGPVEYGARPGLQGIPGEPIPELQSQIDDLADASIDTTKHLFDVNQKVRETRTLIEGTRSKLEQFLIENENLLSQSEENIQSVMNEHYAALLEQTELNADAVMNLMNYTWNKFSKIENLISIVVKLIAALYPNAHIDMYPDEEIQTVNVLKTGDNLSTDFGGYNVQNVYTDSEGYINIKLESSEKDTQLAIETLKAGDSVYINGEEYFVIASDINGEGGTISLNGKGTQYLVMNLKQGDTVNFNGGTFKVNSVAMSNGQGTLSLTLNG